MTTKTIPDDGAFPKTTTGHHTIRTFPIRSIVDRQSTKVVLEIVNGVPTQTAARWVLRTKVIARRAADRAVA